jgi:cell wall-associated NlpC family hydrolase
MFSSPRISDKLFVSSLATAVVVAAPASVDSSVLDKESSAKMLVHPNQTLSYGKVGVSVEALQTKLKDGSFYHQAIDGIYGPLTLSAVRQFQAQSGLSITGTASPDTISKLFAFNKIELQQEIKHQVTENKSYPLLQVGDEGKTVVYLQKQLKNYGYYTSKVDGIYGKITYNAVLLFQRKNELKVDGKAGKQTLSKLESGNIVKNHPSKVKVSQLGQAHSNAIKLAKQLVGTPYVWGGTTPQGFDCSGFLKYIFKQQGINIPRTVSEMWNYGKSIKKPSVGDLVFFETYKPGPSHAGIYIGDNRFIQAGSSNGVKISKMSNSYWSTRYLGAKRMVQKK